MEHKTFKAGDVTVDEAGRVKVRFSTLNVIDKGNDFTLPGAFGNQNVRISAYGHASWNAALPVGKGVISETADAGVFDGSFFLDMASGMEHYKCVKAMGDLQEWSYGYDVLKSEDARGCKACQKTSDAETCPTCGGATVPVRVLKALKVHEVSPVLLGMGENTGTLDIKSVERFVDNAARVLAEVEGFVERAREVKGLRSAKGREIGADSKVKIEKIADVLDEMQTEVQRLLGAAEKSQPSIESEVALLELENTRRKIEQLEEVIA